MLYSGGYDVWKVLVAGTIGKLLHGQKIYAARIARALVRVEPAVDAIWKAFATYSPSGRDKETYSIFGLMPGVSKWSERKGYAGMPEYPFQIRNEDWFIGYSFHEKFVRRLQINEPLIRAGHMMERILHHKDELALSQLTDTVTLGYDGVALFSAAHPLADGTTQSNYHNAGAGSALSMTVFVAALQNFEGLEDPSGSEEFGSFCDTLIVGRNERINASDIVLGSTKLVTDGAGAGAAITNQLNAYSVDLVVVPHTVPTDFAAMFDTSNPDIRAVIMQEEKTPENRTNMDNPNDYVRRTSGEIQNSADAAYNVGPGEYLKAYRIK